MRSAISFQLLPHEKTLDEAKQLHGNCVYSFPIGCVSYLLYLMDPYINLRSIGHVRSYRGDAINNNSVDERGHLGDEAAI
jgi:hypothetical protein